MMVAMTNEEKKGKKIKFLLNFIFLLKESTSSFFGRS